MNLTQKSAQIESVSFIEKKINILVNKLTISTKIENITKLKNLSFEELNNFTITEDYIYWPSSKKKLYLTEILNLVDSGKNTFNYHLQYISIDKITTVKCDLDDNYSLLYDSIPEINAENIVLLLLSRPTIAKRKNNRYECLTNTRIVNMAKKSLSSEVKIPILVINSLSTKKLALLKWNEFFLFPLIHRYTKKSIKYFYLTWEENKNSENTWISKSLNIVKDKKSAFAKAFNVYPREL